MEWNELQADSSCKGHKLRDFIRGDRSRLIDDHVLRCLKGAHCKAEVRVVGRRYHHQLDRCVCQQFVYSAVSYDAGITLSRIVGTPLDDRREFQTFDRGDKRGMKDAA